MCDFAPTLLLRKFLLSAREQMILIHTQLEKMFTKITRLDK